MTEIGYINLYLHDGGRLQTGTSLYSSLAAAMEVSNKKPNFHSTAEVRFCVSGFEPKGSGWYEKTDSCKP